MSRLKQIAQYGQQIWLDNLSRELLDSGKLARWMAEDAIAGVTSNPAIFYNAIRNDPAYQADLARLRREIPQAEARFEALVLPDIRRACDILRPVYEAAQKEAGFVSFEVSPALAQDASGTLAAALRLWRDIGRPNVMIKIPATKAGLEATAGAIAAGVNVNVTLIFGPRQLAAAQEAYRQGLKRRAAQNEPVGGIASVASVFISRIDSLLDPQLPANLQGKVAIASARAAFARLGDLPPLPEGGKPQKLLWASTSSKNPAYRDVRYVEELIGPDTINTVPDATLEAFRDHGKAAATLNAAPEETQAILAALAEQGIDLDKSGETLLAAGLKQFEEAFAKLLELVA
jgi:transaldolase